MAEAVNMGIIEEDASEQKGIDAGLNTIDLEKEMKEVLANDVSLQALQKSGMEAMIIH